MSIDADDRTPRIDKVTMEYERKGTCKGCGGKVTRTKSFSGLTTAACQAQADEWAKRPLKHKRCE